jgi:hypothetical protein
MKINTIITTLVILLILGFASFSFLFSNPELVTKKESFECKGRTYTIEKSLNGLLNFYNEKRDSQNIMVSEDKFGYQLIIKEANLNVENLEILNCTKEKYTITIITESGFESNSPNLRYCYFANPFKQNLNEDCVF